MGSESDLPAYRTIVADPPWDHRDGTGVNPRENNRVTGLPYGTMTLDEIKALPVFDLTTNIGHDAHLYLWTTSRYLRDAFDVMREWGFHYSATLVWCKESRGWSIGGAFQNNVEFALYGKRPKRVARPDHVVITTQLRDAAVARGLTPKQVDELMGFKSMASSWWLSPNVNTCKAPSLKHWPKLKEVLGLGDDLDAVIAKLNEPQPFTHTPQAVQTRWFQWPRGAHSAKPEAFMDMVEQVSPGPYLEMFSRRARLGWDTWGDQALHGTEAMA